MMTLADLRRRAERAYEGHLQAWLRGEPYQPVAISGLGDSLQNDPAQRKDWLAELQSQSKTALGYGYTVELQTRNTRAAAMQSIVRSVMFETLPDLLLFLGKNADFEAFTGDVERLRNALPELANWPERHWKHIIAHTGRWPELLEVALFFKNNPRPQLHLRELPLSVNTKFVETHTSVLTLLLDALLPEIPNPNERDFARRYGLLTDEPRIRFRWLDPTSAQKFTNGYIDLSVLKREFLQQALLCRTVLVVENKTNLMTLERVLNEIQLPEAVVVFGGGFGVAQLQKATWLHDRNLFYWGDLDAHGFQILNQIRTYFPHTKSILMDRDTLYACQASWVKGEPSFANHLDKLVQEEHGLFLFLKENNIRLEQEKLPESLILPALLAL